MIKNSYSFWGYLRLAIFVIRTKFISSKARIIRFPIEIRGKRFIDFGSRLTTGKGCRLEVFSTKEKKLFFGNDVQINDYVHISVMSSVSIVLKTVDIRSPKTVISVHFSYSLPMAMQIY